MKGVLPIGSSNLPVNKFNFTNQFDNERVIAMQKTNFTNQFDNERMIAMQKTNFTNQSNNERMIAMQKINFKNLVRNHEEIRQTIEALKSVPPAYIPYLAYEPYDMIEKLEYFPDSTFEMICMERENVIKSEYYEYNGKPRYDDDGICYELRSLLRRIGEGIMYTNGCSVIYNVKPYSSRSTAVMDSFMRIGIHDYMDTMSELMGDKDPFLREISSIGANAVFEAMGTDTRVADDAKLHRSDVFRQLGNDVSLGDLLYAALEVLDHARGVTLSNSQHPTDELIKASWLLSSVLFDPVAAFSDNYMTT